MGLFAWRTDVRRLLEREENMHGRGEEKVQNILFPCHNGWYLSPTVRGTAGRIWRVSICELLCENQVHKWHCLASQVPKCGIVGYKQVICPCFQGCLSNLWENSPVISHGSSQQWQYFKKFPGQEQERQMIKGEYNNVYCMLVISDGLIQGCL